MTKGKEATRGRPEKELQTSITAKFFRGLGDPTRLKILEYLLEGPKSVTQLVDLLGSPQGRVSNHLACLRWCGYVSARREGRYIYYLIADARVKELLMLAREMVAKNAEHIMACMRIR